MSMGVFRIPGVQVYDPPYKEYAKDRIKEILEKTNEKLRGFGRLIIVKNNLTERYEYDVSDKDRLDKDKKKFEECKIYSIKRIYNGVNEKTVEKIGKELAPLQKNYERYGYIYLEKEKGEILEQLDKLILK